MYLHYPLHLNGLISREELARSYFHLAAGTLDAVRTNEGVEEAIPIYSQYLVLDLQGKKQPLYMVGYDNSYGGGPWRMAEGREPRADGEVVIDSVLAARHEVGVGVSAGVGSWGSSSRL